MNKEKIKSETPEVKSEATGREKIIVRTSIIGIAANVFLSVFKAIIGFMTQSIAITMDAVNNLSDAASSLITIVGTKLAVKPADKKHPFGHGRIEYLTAMVISVLVLYAGITSLTESVKKILHPETPNYTAVSLIIVAVAVVVKIVLGRYVKAQGTKVHSDSLVNSGQDATLDAVISASTLAAAIIYLVFHVSLEAWLGAIISALIIKSGVEMLRDTISQLLGERVDAKQAMAIKETIKSFPGVSGAYDLVLNNYGPDVFNGSVHVEVPDTYTAEQLDDLLRQIMVKVYQEHHVLLTAIGVYSVNTKNDQAAHDRDKVREAVMAIHYVRQMHGFFINYERKTLRFDVVVSLNAPDRQAVYQTVCDKVQAMYPGYQLQVAMDIDFAEI